MLFYILHAVFCFMFEEYILHFQTLQIKNTHIKNCLIQRNYIHFILNFISNRSINVFQHYLKTENFFLRSGYVHSFHLEAGLQSRLMTADTFIKNKNLHAGDPPPMDKKVQYNTPTPHSTRASIRETKMGHGRKRIVSPEF